MADKLSTINKMTFSGNLLNIEITDSSTDIDLGSISLPDLSSLGTIAIINVRARLMIGHIVPGGTSLGSVQYIQVKKGVGGAWANAIHFPFTPAFEYGAASKGLELCHEPINGNIDVHSTIDAFNQTYYFQWNDAYTANAGEKHWLGDMYVELDVWFTIDSGVEAKVDTILNDWADGGRLDLILDNAESNSASAANDSADLLAVTKLTEGNSVSDVGNTDTTFKTNLAETDDDYWNDHTLIVNDPALSALIARRIVDYDGTTKFITVSEPLPYTPADLTSFSILGRVVQNTYDVASGAVVADGGTTTTYFKTNLSSTTLNYWQNLQVLFLTGNNAGIVRRISGYSVAKFITLAEALPNLPVAADRFIIIGRVAGAGSSMTETGIADAIWDELKAGHTASTSFGKIVQDLETFVTAIKVVTDLLNGKLPTNNIIGSSDKDNHDTDIDSILEDTADIQPKVATIHGKLPSSTYLKGTADADGGMDTADKADVKAQADQALSDYDPPTRTEATADKDEILVEVNANEAKVDIVTSMVAQIQNNVFFSTTVLDMYQRPAAGSSTYRIRALIYDGTGNPEDPDSDEIYITLDGTGGNIVPRTLMTKQAVGIYYYDLTIQSTDTLEDWTFTFDYLEAAVLKPHYRQSALTEWTSDLNDIQNKVDAIHVKVDAIAPSPTIPAQILQHDTDIKALPRVEACPDLMYVPSGRTQIDIEGGITDIDTEIPVKLSDNLPSEGMVKIENEYILYSSVSDSKLQVSQRGAYSTTPVAHDDGVAVTQSIVFPIRLAVFDNEGNMKAPDSAPTIEIEDWKGTQEVAPSAMTLISTGLYGYNYIIDYGTVPENKLFKFVVIVNSITRQIRHEVVVIDQIASNNDLVQYLGGGTGEFVIDQDGWYDEDGIKTLWTDTMKGYVRDADTGAPLDDAYVTAYPYIDGETVYSGRPSGQARTRVNGTWIMYLDAGTYTFVIEKDGFRIVSNGVVNRSVG